jgi:hypothetical protein
VTGSIRGLTLLSFAHKATVDEMLRRKADQAQIDRFVFIYNEQRPHTARGCPPMQAWRALDKATITIDGQPLLAHTKVRRDRIDKTGCFTLRYRSKLHHVGVGRAHRGTRVLILVADLDIRVIDQDGVMIRHLELDPSVDYQWRELSFEGSRVPENLTHHKVDLGGHNKSS